MIICLMLSEAGYNVYESCDGLEALAELKKRRYDAVLTDYHMPKMDGLELLDLVQAMWPETPVILASSDVFLTDQVVNPAACDSLRDARSDEVRHNPCGSPGCRSLPGCSLIIFLGISSSTINRFADLGHLPFREEAFTWKWNGHSSNGQWATRESNGARSSQVGP